MKYNLTLFLATYAHILIKMLLHVKKTTVYMYTLSNTLIHHNDSKMSQSWSKMKTQISFDHLAREIES